MDITLTPVLSSGGVRTERERGSVMVFSVKRRSIGSKFQCCPSSWDCSSWEERLRRWDECFWADEKDPRGRYYAIGDPVPEATDIGACRSSCTCSEGPGMTVKVVSGCTRD